jgi:hypothetical protein
VAANFQGLHENNETFVNVVQARFLNLLPFIPCTVLSRTLAKVDNGHPMGLYFPAELAKDMIFETSLGALLLLWPNLVERLYTRPEDLLNPKYRYEVLKSTPVNLAGRTLLISHWTLNLFQKM